MDAFRLWDEFRLWRAQRRFDRLPIDQQEKRIAYWERINAEIAERRAERNRRKAETAPQISAGSDSL